MGLMTDKKDEEDLSKLETGFKNRIEPEKAKDKGPSEVCSKCPYASKENFLKFVGGTI
jgi:hypothetical protein